MPRIEEFGDANTRTVNCHNCGEYKTVSAVNVEMANGPASTPTTKQPSTSQSTGK